MDFQLASEVVGQGGGEESSRTELLPCGIFCYLKVECHNVDES